MTPTAMIFAAGFGTRMGELTATTPKPMLPFLGKPLIDRSIDIARSAGVSKIVANTHYLHEQIAPHLEHLGVEVVHEQAEILDTGGGLLAARTHLSSPTVTLNPDVGWIGPNPVSTLLQAWDEGAEALLLVVPKSQTVSRHGDGDFSLNEGTLTRGGDLVYTGAQLIRTENLDRVGLSVFSLNAYWDEIADRGGLRGVVYPGTWCDIGTPEGLHAAEELIGGSDV